MVICETMDSEVMEGRDADSCAGFWHNSPPEDILMTNS